MVTGLRSRLMRLSAQWRRGSVECFFKSRNEVPIALRRALQTSPATHAPTTTTRGRVSPTRFMQPYCCMARRWASSDEAIRFLKGLTNYEKQGMEALRHKGVLCLDRIKRLLWKVGDPQNTLRVMHVAGSKGKGSVSSFLASIFSASGINVGLSLSPHVLDVTERISIAREGTNGDLHNISLVELEQLVMEHKAMIEEMGEENELPTYFETLTAMMLLHFERNGVRHAVVETGLGGINDATNVFEDDNVDGTVLCPMEEEHLGILGADLWSIVENETAITKPNRRVIIAQQPSQEIHDRIVDLCKQKNCHVYDTQDISVEHHSYVHTTSSIEELVNIRIGKEIIDRKADLLFHKLQTRLIGRHQHENMKTAIAAAIVAKRHGWEVSEKALRRGVRDAFLPGRFQTMRASADDAWIVLDGAHTKEAAKALTTTMREVFPAEAKVLILSIGRGKQHEKILTEIIEMRPDVVIFTSMHSGGSLPPGTLLALWEKCENAFRQNRPFRCRKTLTVNIATAIAKARNELRGIRKMNAISPGVICVTGSLHLAGEALEALQQESYP